LPDWSVSVKLPAEPLRQPSIVWLLLSEDEDVVVVCVVVLVVELVSGVWLDGEVLDGELVCGYPLLGAVDCGLEVDGEVLLGDCELGDDDEPVWAATQTADSSRIAVIRNDFLITSSWYFRPDLFGLEYWEVATVTLDKRRALRFASRELLNTKESGAAARRAECAQIRKRTARNKSSTRTKSINGYGSFAAIGNMISRAAFSQLRHSGLLLVAMLLGLALFWAQV
jgi:hypothetical protein